MTLINAARFAVFAPKALPGTAAALEAAAVEYGLTEPVVLAAWLGQMFVESKGFSTLSESLNYSVAGLRATFGPHRISDADCQRLGRIDPVVGGVKTVVRKADQVAIANIVYGGKWGRENLGNTEPNDGWDMRGGGVKQITGRDNYRQAGHENDPDTLRTNIVESARAAAGFFVKHGCVAPARLGNTIEVTERVNGGRNGLPERIAQTKAARPVVGL